MMKIYGLKQVGDCEYEGVFTGVLKGLYIGDARVEGKVVVLPMKEQKYAYRITTHNGVVECMRIVPVGYDLDNVWDVCEYVDDIEFESGWMSVSTRCGSVSSYDVWNKFVRSVGCANHIALRDSAVLSVDEYYKVRADDEHVMICRDDE